MFQRFWILISTLSTTAWLENWYATAAPQTRWHIEYMVFVNWHWHPHCPTATDCCWHHILTIQWATAQQNQADSNRKVKRILWNWIARPHVFNFDFSNPKNGPSCKSLTDVLHAEACALWFMCAVCKQANGPLNSVVPSGYRSVHYFTIC